MVFWMAEIHNIFPQKFLGLVTNGGHAPVVDEGENSFGVVSGDEFCGLADIVHVCAVGRAGHLEPANGHEAELAALAGVGVIVRQGNTCWGPGFDVARAVHNDVVRFSILGCT